MRYCVCVGGNSLGEPNSYDIKHFSEFQRGKNDQPDVKKIAHCVLCGRIKHVCLSYHRETQSARHCDILP
ncbi:hypothetical protein EZS27_023027 [termite gut metagenome]|uniref:Uncharacterized protein n=1 Tax=termite gut metagenome TaxID=433724 RepID=A0A5J4R1M9_9ZZZZ